MPESSPLPFGPSPLGPSRTPRKLHRALSPEIRGGLLLLLATVVALIWANSPWAPHYFSLRDAVLGADFNLAGVSFHLKLSVGAWIQDGLLALFFFLAGLELKQEFVVGQLRRFSRAVVPVAAAFGGVVVPALIFALVNFADAQARRGWAVPTATDIAFALAILAVISPHLPVALRTFMLTLAIVDDLIAIVIIALFYSGELRLSSLLTALVPLLLFAVVVRIWPSCWYLLLPLALLTWVLVHESGIHATISGVLLAFCVPVRAKWGAKTGASPAESYKRILGPISDGIAVPLFALSAAGVSIGGLHGLGVALTDSVAVGIVLGLVVGKSVGVFGTTWLLTRLSRARLDAQLSWRSMAGLSLLAGVGFTVALLVNDLSYGAESTHGEHAKVAILLGSLLAAALAVVVLRTTHRGGSANISVPK